MSKNFKLSSKSDMRRFISELEQEIHSSAEKEILSREYEVECPDCHNKISIKPGKSFCPICQSEIEFNLDIKYEK